MVKYHYKLREFLLRNFKVKKIILAPKNLFSDQGVNVNPAITLIEKRSPENGHKVIFIDRLRTNKDYYAPRLVREIPQNLFLKIDGSPISINVNEFVVRLFTSLPKIGEVLDGHIGLHTHNNKRFIAAIEGTELAEKFIKRRKECYSEASLK